MQAPTQGTRRNSLTFLPSNSSGSTKPGMRIVLPLSSGTAALARFVRSRLISSRRANRPSMSMSCFSSLDRLGGFLPHSVRYLLSVVDLLQRAHPGDDGEIHELLLRQLLEGVLELDLRLEVVPPEFARFVLGRAVSLHASVSTTTAANQ